MLQPITSLLGGRASEQGALSEPCPPSGWCVLPSRMRAKQAG